MYYLILFTNVLEAEFSEVRLAPPYGAVFLMYARTTSLTISYIRNMIPDDLSIPFWGALPYRGGAKRFFSTYVKAEI